MGAPKPSPLVLILAGGSGTRFWPMSRRERPKQYLDFFDGKSLLQRTLERTGELANATRTYICSASLQKKLLVEQLNPLPQLILEPEARNTAPCLMLSTLMLLRAGHSGDTPVVVCPADHFVGNPRRLNEILISAANFAVNSKGLVTLGIEPTHPHTGYGYIERGSQVRHEGEPTFQVKRFVEKPDRARAETFLKEKTFFWNSGMFVWRLDAIAKAFDDFLTDDWRALGAARDEKEIAAAYAKLPKVAIDVAVMEKANNVFVVPAGVDWSDVGSWGALWEMSAKDPNGNVGVSDTAKAIGAKNCLVKSTTKRKIALVGVKDLIVVDDGERLLIVDRNQDQLVKDISKDEAF